MLHKTKGIVVHAAKYSDVSWIVTIFTEQFGRESYMVYGINKKKASFRAAYLFPFTQVEMNVSHATGKDIHQIKEVLVTQPANQISQHPVKNAIALFLAEVLFKTLNTAEPDFQLYGFLENSIQILEHCKEGVANFHLLFLVRLTRYLGFEPNIENSDNSVFDLLNGVFTSTRPNHVHYLPVDDSCLLAQLLQSSFLEMEQLNLDRNTRNQMLQHLITYYRLHVTGFNGVQSVSILHELFD